MDIKKLFIFFIFNKSMKKLNGAEYPRESRLSCDNHTGESRLPGVFGIGGPRNSVGTEFCRNFYFRTSVGMSQNFERNSIMEFRISLLWEGATGLNGYILSYEQPILNFSPCNIYRKYNSPKLITSRTSCPQIPCPTITIFTVFLYKVW
jgi:hypothetical protein